MVAAHANRDLGGINSMRRRIHLIALLVVFTPSLALAVDTVAVCPRALRSALEPWLKYRTAQGHKIDVIPAGASAKEITDRIRQVATKAAQNGGKLKAVVLVGDVPSLVASTNVNSVPSHRITTKVITKYGGDKFFSSDNGFSDLDGDNVPDLAVGRMTADSPAELGTVIEKIVAYESNPDFGLWRRKVNLIAGVGGFGVLIDGVIESTTKMFLTSGIPAEFRTTMTQASWTSPYCPPPPRFSSTSIGRMNEGCLFWVYIGHGNRRSLDWLRVPGRVYPILTADDVPQIKCERGPPVALFFSCFTGAFDAREDCLAEELLRRKSGPVAVIAGSNVTMPYANAILASGMLTGFFEKRHKTIGEALLFAKQQLASNSLPGERRQMLDTLALLMTGSKHDLADERTEHVQLFNLIGDPLLRIRHPKTLKVKAPATAIAGAGLSIAVECPFPGDATVELNVRRDRLAFKRKPRPRYVEDQTALAEYARTYLRANDLRLASTKLSADSGAFATRLRVPDGATGPCNVCVFVQGKNDFAVGSVAITIQKAESDAVQ
jgi:hypothetical protein